jgi:phosphoglycerate dehydrogenase-like enzyme
MTARHESNEPIIIFDPHPRSKELIFRPQQWDRLQTLGRIVHAGEGRLDADTVDRYLPEAAALIGQTDLPTERLKRAKNLKAILNVEGNFLPNVDYETCFQKGIQVLAAAPAFALAVAESALAFALDLARGITAADRDFRAGNEEYGLAGNRDTFSLRQVDVGLIGFGNLARALVPLLAPFHCRIRVFDPWLPDSYVRDHHCEPASLEDVLSTSRVIFILATVTTENEGFIDDTRLALIQQGAAVILVSRAAVVDFEAFVRHVEEGHFRAATDVFPVEPVPPDDQVRQVEGLLLSAHRTGGLRDSFFRIGDMTIDDLSLIIAGLPPVRMQVARRETVARARSKPGRSYKKEELDS